MVATKVISENKYLWLITLVDGFVWLRSSYGKLSSGNFIDSLSGILTKFASDNPYPWFKDFLQGSAIPNASLFGSLTLIGEVFAGVTIVTGSLFLLSGAKAKSKAVLVLLKLGLLSGAFLNAVFYFAAGWTSSSTETLNLVMFAVQMVGALAVWRLLVGRKV